MSPHDDPPVTTEAERVKPGEGSKGGRPKIELDWDAVARLLRAGNTNEDIAAILGIARSTLQGRFAEHPDRVDKARAERRDNLRTRQTMNALSGSDRMLIHLGEQELGQRRRIAIAGDPDGPPVAVSIAEIVALGTERRAERLAAEAAAREAEDGNDDPGEDVDRDA